MVCWLRGFIIQRHNELRDLEAEMLRMVCNDVEVELVLQEVTGETLNHGANKAPDACLDIHARGFWERQRSAFFDVRVCHPHADSYRDLNPKQIQLFQLTLSDQSMKLQDKTAGLRIYSSKSALPRLFSEDLLW